MLDVSAARGRRPGSAGRSAVFGTARRRARTTVVALPAAAVLLLALTAALRNDWARFGVPAVQPTFGDLRQLTATAACARTAGWNWTSPTCDPFGRPYNYPSAWARLFGAMGVSESSTEALGYVLIVLLAASVLVLALLMSRPRPTALGIAVLCAAAVSPPVRLLLERGNIDVFIFALLVVALAIARTRVGALFPPLLALAAYLKLYPVGAGLALLVTGRSRPPDLWVYLLLTGVGLLSLFPQYASIAGGTPQVAEASFGLSVVPMELAASGLSWVSDHPRRLGLVAFLCSFAITAMVARAARGRAVAAIDRSLRRVATDTVAGPLVVGGSGALLVAYCVGSSFDYRQVFAVIAIAGLLRTSTKDRVLSYSAVVLTALLWLSYPLGAAQIIGDLGYFVLMPVLGVGVLRIVSFKINRAAVRKAMIATFRSPTR